MELTELKSNFFINTVNTVIPKNTYVALITDKAGKKNAENVGSAKSINKPEKVQYDTEYIRKLRKKLKASFKPDKLRYEHSLSVSYTTLCLAMRYGYDIHKAEVAGLLHDCAKKFGHNELISLSLDAGIELSGDILKAPQVIHSLYGAYYAKRKYKIEDEEILQAISSHTLGRPGMAPLEKMVFVADYIEPRRTKARRLAEIRQIAFISLDQAVYEILNDTVGYLKEKGAFICKVSLDTYDYYRKLILNDF